LNLVKILKHEEIKKKRNLNHCQYDLRKHLFNKRIIAVWNCLPDNVVDVNNYNILKNRLENHWCILDIMYDFESDLTGIENRSFDRVIMLIKLINISIFRCHLLRLKAWDRERR
jgi:hypothetical protein